MSRVSAWITDVSPGCRAALGVRDLLHLVPTPVTVRIPRAPAHCCSVLRWEGRLLPVVDLAVLLDGAEPQAEYRCVGVVGYRAAGESAISFGALGLTALPTKLELAEVDGCGLPDALTHWRPYANACFDHLGPVPVLHVASLFRPLTTHACG
jgi:hypothetical protein